MMQRGISKLTENSDLNKNKDKIMIETICGTIIAIALIAAFTYIVTR